MVRDLGGDQGVGRGTAVQAQRGEARLAGVARISRVAGEVGADHGQRPVAVVRRGVAVALHPDRSGAGVAHLPQVPQVVDLDLVPCGDEQLVAVPGDTVGVAAEHVHVRHVAGPAHRAEGGAGAAGGVGVDQQHVLVGDRGAGRLGDGDARVGVVLAGVRVVPGGDVEVVPVPRAAGLGVVRAGQPLGRPVGGGVVGLVPAEPVVLERAVEVGVVAQGRPARVATVGEDLLGRGAHGHAAVRLYRADGLAALVEITGAHRVFAAVNGDRGQHRCGGRRVGQRQRDGGQQQGEERAGGPAPSATCREHACGHVGRR